MAKKKNQQNKYDREHLRRLALYQRMIDDIYDQYAEEAAKIAAVVGDLAPDTLFSFSDYPLTHKRVDKLMSGLKKDILACVVNGINAEWTLANNKNNELARMVFGDNVGRLSQAQYRKYFSTNDKAREAFLSRKTAGLGLSDRVWNYTNQFKTEIELGLDIGIRTGLSADQMSRDLRGYLRNPDKLFRRVRDEHGLLRLSQRAAAYHPGQGVYRSSYKNARRLAVTETNMAYRTADYERWQEMDFVVGIEIRLSNNHTINGLPLTDICDDLAGRYPKDFKFTGWHPHCRCHAVTILKTKEEMAEDTQRILEGKFTTGKSVNAVRDVPAAFNRWVAENRDRIMKADGLPYFLRDNEQYLQQAIRLSEPVAAQVGTVNSLSEVKSVFNRFKIRGNEESYFTDGIAGKFDFLGVRERINAIAEKHGINIDRWTATVHGEGIFNIDAEQSYLSIKDQKFNITRTFFDQADGLMVHHDYFVLGKEFQGKGISKEVFRVFYEQYKAMGVRYITVQANIDIGGYTWMRYGFSATSKDAALSAWDFVEETPLVKKCKAFIEDWYRKNNLPDSHPFPMRLFQEGSWKGRGKEILLGTNWDGVIDLSDASIRKIFESYLGL